MNATIKYICAGLFGMIGLIEPTFKFAFILFFAIVLDCVSAFNLSRRVKKHNPDKASGKFKSRYAWKMAGTFLKAYSVILLLHYVDKVLLHMHEFHLANYASALFCFIQVWSILENLSSENGQRWAKLLQRFMVNKAARHLDIDLKNLNEKEDTKDEQ